jgi:anthranilate/para-aminobenzoate synthase component I
MPTLERLHRFFRQASAPLSHAIMLGGNVEPSPLNRWIIMGFRARQSLVLWGNRLSVHREDTVSDKHVEVLSGANATAQLFERLEQARQRAATWPAIMEEYGLPLQGGLAGVLGYGFYPWCDDGWQARHALRSTEAGNAPDLLLCEFEDWVFLNLETRQLTVLTHAPEREAFYYALWNESSEPEAKPCEARETAEPADSLHTAYLSTFESSFTQPAFECAVETLKTAIRDGEIYQANLSLRLQKALSLDPYRLFEQLCRANPSPFSGFFKWPGGVIVSNSPERLLQVSAEGKAQTRPIAGTRGRGHTPAEDARIGQILLDNEKELAEHRMLVDLARNDLGRVCEAGSVRVDDLLVLERYSHVTHLVSNVSGQRRANVSPWELLRALFPGGTITGCPKMRCIEILERIEPVPRGFYTGSLGYIDAKRPAMDWNILIRSLFLRETGLPLRYNAAIHVGAGIVHDAVGAYEYRECLRKATASLSTLRHLETETLSPPSRPLALHKPASNEPAEPRTTRSSL